MKIFKLLQIIYKAGEKTIEHDGVEHAGYMSFMVILSIFPFLVFILALTRYLGASELGQQFIEYILVTMPSYSIESLQVRIDEILKTPPQDLMTLAIAGTIWTSSSFVECLRTILNRVYELNNVPNYLLRRLLSIAQFIIISLMVSVAMFITIIVPVAINKIHTLSDLISEYHQVIFISQYLFIFLSLFITASSLYYIVPNTKISFSHVLPGSFLTVILWISSGYFLSKYIGHYKQLSIVYGSLGSIIVTLIFFYIVNMIFIYGAEFNYLLHLERDKK